MTQQELAILRNRNCVEVEATFVLCVLPEGRRPDKEVLSTSSVIELESCPKRFPVATAIANDLGKSPNATNVGTEVVGFF